MSGTKREVLEVLCDDVEIPEIVTAKAEAAFQKIRMSGYMDSEEAVSESRVLPQPAGKNIEQTDERKMVSSPEISERKRPGKKRLRRAWKVGIAAACAAVTVTVGVGAAYRQWSRSLEKGMQADEKLIEKLESDGNLTSIGQSVTDEGVTVTMTDCLVDKNCAFLIFKVEGYTPEDHQQPGFAGAEVTAADGSGLITGTGGMSMAFYDGLSMDINGMAVTEDGTPCTTDEDGIIIEQYADDDGSLEYQIAISSDVSGELIGKSVHVKLQGLGVFSGDEEELEVDVDGTWSFDFDLPGSDNALTCEFDETLGDTQAVLSKAEITPLSATVYLTFPRQEITEKAVDADGNETEVTSYAEPPAFMGFQMKDGTLMPTGGGGGRYGYADENDETNDTYEILDIYGRVADTDQIESLLFLKTDPETLTEGEFNLTEDDFYIIPLE